VPQWNTGPFRRLRGVAFKPLHLPGLLPKRFSSSIGQVACTRASRRITAVRVLTAVALRHVRLKSGEKSRQRFEKAWPYDIVGLRNGERRPQCHEIEALVWRASPEWAPADTIYCDLAGRKTITDSRDQETLAAPGHDPSRPAGERRRFSL
jgi:hypothetical protein